MRSALTTFALAIATVGAVWLATQTMDHISGKVNDSPFPQVPAVGFQEREQAIRAQHEAMSVLAAFDMAHGPRPEDGPKRMWVNGSIQ